MRSVPDHLLVVGACVLVAAASSAQSTGPERSGFVVTSDGVRLHYVEAGKGPSLVFVPGWTSSVPVWERQIRHFSTRHRVVAMDPRSQGESEQATEGHYPERRAQDIKELIERLKLGPAVLVGHSMAVGELLTYVEQFGTTNLAAVALVDAPIGSDPSIADMTGFVERVKALSVNRRQVLEEMVARFFRTPLTRAERRRLIDGSMNTPTNTAIALAAASFGRDHRPVLATFDKPLLYAITPKLRDQAEMLKVKVPGARIEIFERSGHVLFVDEADRFNEVLGEFARAAFAAAR